MSSSFQPTPNRAMMPGLMLVAIVLPGARHRWPSALAAILVMLVGCRSPDGASQAPDDAGTVPPVQEPAGQDAGATDPAATGERYLAEERWNAASVEPGPASTEGPVPADPTMAEPTEAEFQAWDRKDPAAEKRLYAWDQANFARLQQYVHDLECFRARMVAAGEAGRGAVPGTLAANAWIDAKRALILELDAWLQQLFANEPRIFEKSKLIGTLLEAHELVARDLPVAYDGGDQHELDRTAAHWVIVLAKVDKYAKALGKTTTRASDAYCKAKAGSGRAP